LITNPVVAGLPTTRFYNRYISFAYPSQLVFNEAPAVPLTDCVPPTTPSNNPYVAVVQQYCTGSAEMEASSEEQQAVLQEQPSTLNAYFRR
jgi:hypothetical protein